MADCWSSSLLIFVLSAGICGEVLRLNALDANCSYSGGCCGVGCEFGACEPCCRCGGRVFNSGGPCRCGRSACGVSTAGSSLLFCGGWRYSGGVNPVLGLNGVLGSTTMRLSRVRNAGGPPLRRLASAWAAKLDSTSAVLCSAICPT